MIEKAKAIVKAKKNVHSRAIIVTARADFDDKEMFLQTFRDHGLPIDSMHVERSGNLGMDSPAEAKKVVFRKYLNTQNYTKTRLYDDAMSNLKAFLELRHLTKRNNLLSSNTICHVGFGYPMLYTSLCRCIVLTFVRYCLHR